ncbi:MAG: DUF1659 domain-containing protein [Peptoniphilus sp.]|nr:DUF1659 domain-containing protein [Peptoniphilus sp.]MDY3118348.1 DUF1659 domain-containing protein [Peptoniphilus sp.]
MENTRKSLRLIWEGVDEQGKKTRRSHTYGNVIPEATDENVKAAAQAIEGLCQTPATTKEVTTTRELV